MPAVRAHWHDAIVFSPDAVKVRPFFADVLNLPSAALRWRLGSPAVSAQRAD